MKLEQIQRSIDESQSKFTSLEAARVQADKTLKSTTEERNETVTNVKRMTEQHDDLVRHLEKQKFELMLVKKQREDLDKETQDMVNENRALNEKIKETDKLIEDANRLANEKQIEVTDTLRN
jgi:chromosome segregation ATPase